MSSEQLYFPEGTTIYSAQQAREAWLDLRRNATGKLSDEDYNRLFSNADTGYEILSADEAEQLPQDPNNPWGILYSDRFWTLWRDPVRIGEGDPFMYLRMLGPNLESKTAGVVVISELNGMVNLVQIGRHATRDTHWELPRGFADKVIPAVIKELSQECGHEVDASQVNEIGIVHLDSGLAGHPAVVAHVAVRENQIGESSPSATESIQSGKFFSATEIRAMINSQQITDGPTLSALAILFSMETKPEGSTLFSSGSPKSSPTSQDVLNAIRSSAIAGVDNLRRRTSKALIRR